MKLSIITPYYKTLEQIKRLAKVLEPQLTNQTEWIIIDDGCNEIELDNLKAKVIHLEQNSGGASVPRNVGLDNATGEYITFIDSDDLVRNDYIKEILNKTKENWEYCYISWSINNRVCIIENEPPTWNCCVWNCIYKRDLIGNERFSPDLVIAEDYDFNQRVRKGKRANLVEVLYYYQDTPNSLTKRGITYKELF